jgi:hypothetical protein
MQTHEFVIERGGSVRLAAALRELWTYRAIIVAFAERDIRIKYKQAALGIAWAVIKPLVFMAIFTLTIGRLTMSMMSERRSVKEPERARSGAQPDRCPCSLGSTKIGRS